jgi:hypothetical protein
MRNPTSESGFTLVELMVASLVTMLLMGVAFSTFRDGLALNEAVVNIAESTQNLRSGTNLLTRDLMQAGRNIPIGGISIPSGPSAEPLHRPGPPSTSYTFPNQGVDNTAITAITTGAGLGPLVAGRQTDMVTILMDDPFLPPHKIFPSNAPTTEVRLAADGTTLDFGPHVQWIAGDQDEKISPLKPGDVIFFSAPNGTTLQTVTKIIGSTVFFEPNDPFNFNQPNATVGSITQILPAPCDTTPPVQPCQTGMTIRRVMMYTYYVHAETPGIPRLMRMTNHFTPQALAGVIEDLELSYDLVDGTTNPVNIESLPYTANSVTYKPNQIRKVNVHVGVRSETKTARTKDYLRNHLSTVISLRNLAYVTRYDTEEQ